MTTTNPPAVPPPDETLDALREHIKQVLSDEGAFCGACGFEPGDRGCPDCEKCWQQYADALLPILRGAPDDVAALLKKMTRQADRLRDALAEEERLHADTMSDRDRSQEMADKLAYAVAPEETIGEHSSMNCPWENAYGLITPAAEVARLRTENATLRANALKLVDSWRKSGGDHARFAESKTLTPGLAAKQDGRSAQLHDCADELAAVLDGEDPDGWECRIDIEAEERGEQAASPRVGPPSLADAAQMLEDADMDAAAARVRGGRVVRDSAGLVTVRKGGQAGAVRPGREQGLALRALTVRQPWAFAIAEGFKPVENRSRRTHYRGDLWIHAGQQLDTTVAIVRYSRDAAIRLDQLGGSSSFWDARWHIPSRILPPPATTIALSAIIGTARVVGCHYDEGCCRPWGLPDQWHWELTDTRPLSQAVAAPGRLGLWTPPADTAAAALAARGGAR